MPHLKCPHPYRQTTPAELERLFAETAPKEGTLAELLLNHESTAIFHVDPERTSEAGSQHFVKPILLGVNYHHGHSEGDYKVVVQNILEQKGPYVLFRPPGSEEKTLYLQDLVFPTTFPPKFKEQVDNPMKIHHYYLFRGEPLQVFDDFRKAGFNFSEQAMTNEHYVQLEKLTERAQEQERKRLIR